MKQVHILAPIFVTCREDMFYSCMLISQLKGCWVPFCCSSVLCAVKRMPSDTRTVILHKLLCHFQLQCLPQQVQTYTGAVAWAFHEGASHLACCFLSLRCSWTLSETISLSSERLLWRRMRDSVWKGTPYMLRQMPYVKLKSKIAVIMALEEHGLRKVQERVHI